MVKILNLAHFVVGLKVIKWTTELKASRIEEIIKLPY